MPEGWKPGDPIPGLPASTTGPGAVDEIQEVVLAAQHKEAAVAAKPAPRPFSDAFNFQLNPDMELEFGVEDEDEDEDDSEVDSSDMD